MVLDPGGGTDSYDESEDYEAEKYDPVKKPVVFVKVELHADSPEACRASSGAVAGFIFQTL